MKKFIAMLVAAACTLGAMATEYTGRLGVSINGEGGAQEATVTLQQQEDGNYTLLIKNFCLVTPETTLGVGNIELTDMEGVEEFGFTKLVFDQSITITDGDDPDVPFWMGSTLGEVPIKMTALFNDQTVSVNIDIDMMDVISQIINVDFIGMNLDAAPGPQGKKGDLNGDGKVDISDVNSVINLMLGKE